MRGGGYERKRKYPIAPRIREVRKRGDKEVLSDILSSMHSQNVYGKATSISYARHPEYRRRTEFGRIPTEEEISAGEEQGSMFAIGRMNLGAKAEPKFALGKMDLESGSGKFAASGSGIGAAMANGGGKGLIGNQGKPKWKWL